MTKTAIFEDIVSIVRNDAAFCKDEHGANPDIYRAKITDTMDDEAFLLTVQSYLASFHVAGHLDFRNVRRGFLPFQVKRYHDALYVFKTSANSPLEVGDKIVKIDGISVSDYGNQHADMLYGESEERQGSLWFKLLSFAKEITVMHNGQTEILPITLNGKWMSEDRYFCKRVNENTVYMRLKDFADDTAIVQMYRDNDILLRSCKYLIIDVRANEGGNDSAYYPLFEFCLPCGEKTNTLKEGEFDSGIEINYTERVCDSRLEQFERILKDDIPADTREMLTHFVDELRQNRGKGFIRMGANDDSSLDLPYVGTAFPEKVYVLTDEDCASSGDAFVYDIGKCGKVTVIGRPTMGILDYSNCAGAFYDDFVLIYPTSRSLYLDNSTHMRGRGIPVDIHIPWTPEHCRRDVDMDTVLKLISQE